jgi:hypothetical protein
MNFKKAAATETTQEQPVMRARADPTPTPTPMPTPMPMPMPFYGRPYRSMVVTAEDCPGHRDLSPREWTYEYQEDLEFNFSTLMKVVNQYFPQRKLEYTKELFQEFEKFAFVNSSSS